MIKTFGMMGKQVRLTSGEDRGKEGVVCGAYLAVTSSGGFSPHYAKPRLIVRVENHWTAVALEDVKVIDQ